jgi:hypothetical protein
MELRDRGAPLPRFWAAVRRRHPDVDLVLLAGEPPPPTGEASEADLEAAVERVAAYASGAWAVATDAGDALTPTLRFGPREDTVVARVRVSGRCAASPIPTLASALVEAGWTATSPPGAVELLVARRAGVELKASFAPAGVLSLTVVSAPLLVGVDRARELVRS